ncbi:MAG: efflux RND transporter permease subunit [Pseudomonadota bacterium]
MKPVIAWFAKNHVAANLLMMLLILGGLFTLPQMQRKLFPEVELPLITVVVPYLGASPVEVEEAVCVRIEEELTGIEGMKEIRSYAQEGACRVYVELYESTDESKAIDEVKNRVDSIDTFPEETERSVTTLVTSTSSSVLDITLTGSDNERILKELAYQIRDDIALLPDVTQVSVTNTRPYEISIEVSEASLRRNGLSFSQVADAVRSGSLDLPGGSIKTRGGEILVRTQGQAYRGNEFENLVVSTRADGTRLLLKDVATIIDGFADTDQSMSFNGKPAALIQVSRIGEQDVLRLASTVKAYVREAQQTLPEGVELIVWNDSSTMLRERLGTLFEGGRQGFLMVLLLLALFLRPRLAFWVSLGVPVAFLGAFVLVDTVGIAIDSISLFGFILVLGILVDDAIVIGESVHSRQKHTGDAMRGAVEGAQSVTIPVTFGVLTTVAAFLPLLFITGFLGQIMSVIASTVVCCLVFSLVESQMILPSHLSRARAMSPSAEIGLMLVPILAIGLSVFVSSLRQYVALVVFTASALYAAYVAGYFGRFAEFLLRTQQRFAVGLEHLIDTRFRRAADTAIRARYSTATLALVALMVAMSILASGRLAFSFFPPITGDQVSASLTMPLGTSASVTKQGVERLQASAEALRKELNGRYPDAPPIEHLLTVLGGNGGGDIDVSSTASRSHLAEVRLQLSPSERRTLSTEDIANMWRDKTGPIADVVDLQFGTSIFAAGNDFDLQFTGDNVEDLREVAKQLRMKLAEYPGVFDIRDTFRSGKRELKLSILPSGEALGLSLESLGRQVRQAYYGEEAQRIQRGRDDVRVMVRYTEEERQSLSSLDAMRIRTPDGSEVPFSSVASAELGRGFSTIRRADGRRVVNVIAGVDRAQITPDEILADLRSGPLRKIMAPYPGVDYRLFGSQADQQETLSGLGPGFMLAMFAIYALLAIPLKSYLQPLIIMSVIPFAYMGAIWGHAIMKFAGYLPAMSMMSILGMVAATGVVVNSSLVLVHSVNDRRSRGEGLHEAVLNAAVSRCRPIVLTSVTTFAGLTPLMLNKSVQAAFLVPMACSLAFGVMFATLVTLLVVPSGYMILEDLSEALRRTGRRLPAPDRAA